MTELSEAVPLGLGMVEQTERDLADGAAQREALRHRQSSLRARALLRAGGAGR